MKDGAVHEPQVGWHPIRDRSCPCCLTVDSFNDGDNNREHRLTGQPCLEGKITLWRRFDWTPATTPVATN